MRAHAQTHPATGRCRSVSLPRPHSQRGRTASAEIADYQIRCLLGWFRGSASRLTESALAVLEPSRHGWCRCVSVLQRCLSARLSRRRRWRARRSRARRCRRWRGQTAQSGPLPMTRSVACLDGFEVPSLEADGSALAVLEPSRHGRCRCVSPAALPVSVAILGRAVGAAARSGARVRPLGTMPLDRCCSGAWLPVHKCRYGYRGPAVSRLSA